VHTLSCPGSGHWFEVCIQMKFMKNEEAVSPVIGVILMVAITVILAAVIAAFVFGMAGGVQKTKVVAASVTQEGNDIRITYQGGQDDASVAGLTILSPTGTAYNVTGGASGTCTAVAIGTGSTKPTVGCVVNLVNNGTAAQDKITVTGIFTDGSRQVIMDTTV
jgi:archaeal type IV pilus assembly protein PilA